MVIIDKLKTLFSAKKEVSLKSINRRWTQFFGSWGDAYFSRVEESTLIEEGYINNEDVYAILSKLAIASTDVKIVLKERKGDKIETVINPNNSFLKLLQRPNKDQAQAEYLKERILNYILTGDCFELKQDSIGFSTPSSLRVIPSQFVEIEMQNPNDFFTEVKKYIFTWGSLMNYYEPDQVIHTQNLDPSYCGYKGLSVLQPSYKALSTSNQVHDAEESMIKNRGASGLIFSDTPDYPLQPEERERLDEELKHRIGGAKNYNSTKTSGYKLGYLSLGHTIKELELTTIDIQKMRKICNVLGLSSQLFNDPANKTFNNLAEAKKSMYTEVIIPLVSLFVESWNKDLTPIFNKAENKNYFIDIDVSEIEVLQSDKKLEAEKNKIESETFANISSMVKNNQLDFESAKNILIYTFRISDEEAMKLLSQPNPVQATQPITQNG